VTRDFI